MSVTWLGTSSGNPTVERNVSCTVVQTPLSVVLVDCGEGSHRQLQQAGVDPARVSGIYVTHLHGDHCFGLATSLAMIDAAKAQAAAAEAAAAAGGAAGPDARLAEPLPETHVCGPPGVGELLRVSLALTGEHLRLRTRIVVSELVMDPAHAHGPVELMARPSGAPATRDGAGAGAAPADAAVWNCRSGAAGAAAPAGGTGAATGAAPLLWLQRVGSLSVSDDPELRAAAQAVLPNLSQVPVLWRPPRHWGQPPSVGPGSLTEVYSGWNYVARYGRYWELPGGGGGVTVRAAQLQHRVPCWGYVFSERGGGGGSGGGGGAGAPGRRRRLRKVALLGDTIDSTALAPLALDCDVLAHEATFMAGMEDKCRVAQHSTGYCAGGFAEAVSARQLVLTHFSARYCTNAPPRLARGGRAGGRGGGRGGGRHAPVDTVQQEHEEQARAIGALVGEARTHYRNGPIRAARDFHVMHVPAVSTS